MSVKRSWAPGWGCSRRSSIRVPVGQPDNSTRSVISATSAASRHSAAVGRNRWPPTGSGNCDGHRGQARFQLQAADEPDVAGAARRGELMAGAAGVGAADHLPRGGVDRQLTQRSIQDVDVVGGGTRPGVARSQQPGQRLTGGVQIRHQRVEPEPVLIGRRRVLFIRVDVDEHPVDIDHVETRIGPGRPGRRRARARAGGDPRQGLLIDGGKGAPRRRRRGDLTEQIRLIPQHPQVGDRGRAVGDGHRQIGQHLGHGHGRGALLGRRHRRRQPARMPAARRPTHTTAWRRRDATTPRPPALTTRPGRQRLCFTSEVPFCASESATSTTAFFPCHRRAFRHLPTVSPHLHCKIRANRHAFGDVGGADWAMKTGSLTVLLLRCVIDSVSEGERPTPDAGEPMSGAGHPEGRGLPRG